MARVIILGFVVGIIELPMASDLVLCVHYMNGMRSPSTREPDLRLLAARYMAIKEKGSEIMKGWEDADDGTVVGNARDMLEELRHASLYKLHEPPEFKHYEIDIEGGTMTKHKYVKLRAWYSKRCLNAHPLLGGGRSKEELVEFGSLFTPKLTASGRSVLDKRMDMAERVRRLHYENRRERGLSCLKATCKITSELDGIRAYEDQARQSVLEIRGALAVVGHHIGIAGLLRRERELRNELPPSLPEFRKLFKINKCPEMLLGPSTTTTKGGVDLKIIELARAYQKYSSVEFEHLDARWRLHSFKGRLKRESEARRWWPELG